MDTSWHKDRYGPGLTPAGLRSNALFSGGIPNPMLGTGEDLYARCVPWHHEFVDNVVHVCGSQRPSRGEEDPDHHLYSEAYKIICDILYSLLRKDSKFPAAASWRIPHGNAIWGSHFKPKKYRRAKKPTKYVFVPDVKNTKWTVWSAKKGKR